MTKKEWRDLGAKHGTILGRLAVRITIPAILALAIYHAWVM